MILPEIENDYDEEDTAHEQTNRNEVDRKTKKPKAYISMMLLIRLLS